MNGKTLRIFCNSDCNNNCIMCSVRGTNPCFPTSDEIKEGIRQAKQNNYSKISLIGGEPTLRNDLRGIIRYAKSLSFYVHLTSNCRRMSYKDYTNHLIEAGLNHVSASLYGHNRKLHESITRTPGSFSQTLRGIRNLAKRKIRLDVNVVIMKQNLPHLGEIVNFLEGRDITKINLINVSPIGNASSLMFSPSMKELKQGFSRLNLGGRNSDIIIFDIPFCVLDKTYHGMVFNMREDKTDVLWGRKRSSNRLNYAALKTKPRACLDCRLYDKCNGIWMAYYRKYGCSETSPVR